MDGLDWSLLALLAERGEQNIAQLTRAVGQPEAVVLRRLAWLSARVPARVRRLAERSGIRRKLVEPRGVWAITPAGREAVWRRG